MLMKKIISVMFVFLLLNLTFPLSVFAAKDESDNVIVEKQGNEEIIEPNSRIILEFERDFNVNQAERGDEVPFILTHTIKDNAGNVLIPQNTRFIGEVTSQENSKWGFRRAIATVRIKTMVFPDGRMYYINSEPEKGELKSPAALNALKGVATGTVAVGVCVVSAIVIAIEAMSIFGLLFAPEMGIIAGVGITFVSKGLNYKAKRGTQIAIVLDSPLAVEFND